MEIGILLCNNINPADALLISFFAVNYPIVLFIGGFSNRVGAWVGSRAIKQDTIIEWARKEL